MAGRRIGDFAYLRRLGDLLVPRSKDVLPTTVADQPWLPVIPYNTDLDLTRYYALLINDNNPPPFITGAQYLVTAGSSQYPSIDFALPSGWVYELIEWEFLINLFVLPAAGDYVELHLRRIGYNITFQDIRGGADNKTNFSQDIWENRRTQSPPMVLDPIALTYRWTFPRGHFRTVNGDDVAYNYDTPIIIPCPTGSEGGFTLVFEAIYRNAAHTDKNWNQGAAPNLFCRVLFKRQPIGNYDIRGLYNSS